MTKRWIVLSTLIVLMAFATAWLSFSSKIAYLTLDRRHKIYVNGAPVEGEFLSNGFTTIVTRRDPGNVHSFQLFFAGDIDFTGNIGLVGDCHEWVAPHLPILIQTRSYPPCDVEMRNEHAPGLVQLANSMQFVTKSGSTISIVRH